MKVKSAVWHLRNIGKGKNFPSLFILGSQKCGTSALYDYLVSSENFQRGMTKEPGFFHRDIFLGATLKDYYSKFRGSAEKIYIDATPENIYSVNALTQISTHFPEAKYIVMLRNPVDRAYSAWNHYRDLFENRRYLIEITPINRLEGNYLYKDFYHERVTFPSFEECIDIELSRMAEHDGFEPALLRRGFYLEQLQALWDLVPREKVHVGFTKQLKNNPRYVLQAIEQFLGVVPTDWSLVEERVSNFHPYKDELSPHLRSRLDSYFSNHNAALFEALGVTDWNGTCA